MNRLKLKIKSLLIGTSLIANLIYAPASVLAVPTPPAPPTSPTAPSAPSAPVAPVAPTAPTTPTAPVAPAAPTAPTTPVAPTSNTSNTGSGTNNSSTGNTATNTGNGSNSNNSSNTTTNNETDVTNQNDANVVNVLDIESKSGNNEANKNMGSGVVNSGNSSIDGSLVNNLNNNLVNLDDLCGCAAGSSAANSGNGSSSNNNASTNSNNLVDISNQNNLNLVNNESIGASSGNNEANKNMGDGIIVSGDADVVFTTINFGNNNGIDAEIANFNILDTRTEDLLITFPSGSLGSGGIGAENSGNGADSNNNASSSSNSSTTINNENNLNLDNNVNIYAKTGGNEADKNMGAGDITTGDANIASNIINFLNNNIVAGAEWLLSTVNIYGDMSGDIILPREVDFGSCGCASDITAANIGNGSDSVNTANTNINDSTIINNYNNAIVNNNINLDANTGGNSTSGNMGNSSITTGNVDVNSNLVTIANTNTVGQGDTWWLVIVNNQGEWTGKIVGANDGDTIAGSGLEFGIGPDGNIYALNSGNGSGSNNNASTNVNNTTTINNANNATINNNVNIFADTGNNTANKNMGGANINTGDVNVASNVVNFINNNFVGKRFVVTVVNIFGKFSGDIVPPDQEKQAKGGPVGLNLPQVSLGNETISNKSTNKSNTRTGSVGGSLASAGTTLNNALAEGGKLLENAAVTQGKVSDPVKKVINSDQKSSFQFNYIFIGIALLIIAAYAFYLRKKAVVK